MIGVDLSVDETKRLAEQGLKILEGRSDNLSAYLKHIFELQLAILSTPYERQQKTITRLQKQSDHGKGKM